MTTSNPSEIAHTSQSKRLDCLCTRSVLDRDVEWSGEIIVKVRVDRDCLCGEARAAVGGGVVGEKEIVDDGRAIAQRPRKGLAIECSRSDLSPALPRGVRVGGGGQQQVRLTNSAARSACVVALL